MKTVLESEALDEAIILSAGINPPCPAGSFLGLPAHVVGKEVGRALADELAIAQAIQQSLLPKRFPNPPGFGLAAYCHSAGELGGDFYDVIALGKEKVLLIIADVMGTGVPAALFASSLRTLVRSRAEASMSTSELLTWVNQQMFCELSSVDMFITAQLAVVDTKRGLLRVASAGHCPLLIADKLGQTRVLTPEGLPLGIQANAGFEEQVVPLGECAVALLFTDGLTEACDARGDLFGQERLESWLALTAASHLTAAELQQDFLLELQRFRGRTVSRDDLTMVFMAREENARVARPLERDFASPLKHSTRRG